VVFTTNGGGHHRSRRDKSHEARTSYEEAALSMIGIERDNVMCLRFPDGRLYRYMIDLASDVKNVIKETYPKHVYIHSIEGGHRDHDITSFVVQSVCKQMGYTEVHEWPEHNELHILGDVTINFPPESEETGSELVRIVLTEEGWVQKDVMLTAHKSQVAP
jgi:LmbE family N-acetylglucosaminyl deacetylase